MNSSPENDPGQSAKKRLTEVCRTKDTSLRLVWAITIGEAILLAAFVLALMDYWLMLPIWMRTTGAIGLSLLAAIGLYRLVRFYRRPTRLKEAALDLEAEKPELGCEVSTATEYLTGERKPAREYEHDLAAALQEKAAQHLSAERVPYEKKFIRPALLLGITLLALLIFMFVAPVGWTALQRTAVPFSRAHYTSVLVQPGNVEVPVGADLGVTNVFSGRMPKDPQLHWREQNDPDWQTIALTKDTNGAFVHAFKNLQTNVAYRVTGNDAVSEDFAISTFVPPEVKALEIQLTFPEYTQRKPTTQKSPDITALRATRVEFRVEPTVALSKAKLRFRPGPEAPLRLQENGIWTSLLTVTNESDYWIELADQKGRLGVNPKPYHIKCQPDNPPTVEIAEPGKDIRAAATNKVPVRISVTDDFGVGEIKLVFHKLGGSEQVISVRGQKAENGEVRGQTEIDLASLGLGQYELLAYHAEAADNNTLDGPGIGKSPVYFVEVTNEEGGACLSQGQGQKVNLLVIQKQIIADTTALASKVSSEKFSALNARQGDAAEFARMYLSAISAAPGAEAAAAEMEAAIKSMENAIKSLEQKNRASSLPPEESALAHLYQVVKLMPELENLPTAPPPSTQPKPRSPKVQVVLEAIKQKKKEQPDNKEIEQAIEQAKNLERQQSGLNAAARDAGESSGGKGKTASQSQSKSQSSQATTGKGQSSGKGKGQGEGEPSDNPSSQNDPENAQPKDPAEMAVKEEQLSKETAALAEKLQRLAGKDTRLGHNAPGKAAARAAAKMAAAGQAMAQGRFGAAGEHGFQGELALRSVVAQLERLLKNQPEESDIANEDFPKEYEAVISEYLKQLSHAE